MSRWWLIAPEKIEDDADENLELDSTCACDDWDDELL